MYYRLVALMARAATMDRRIVMGGLLLVLMVAAVAGFAAQMLGRSAGFEVAVNWNGGLRMSP